MQVYTDGTAENLPLDEYLDIMKEKTGIKSPKCRWVGCVYETHEKGLMKTHYQTHRPKGFMSLRLECRFGSCVASVDQSMITSHIKRHFEELAARHRAGFD